MRAVLGNLLAMASRFFARAKNAMLDPQTGWKTTHFWGPVANWGIALSGVYDLMTKDPQNLDMNRTIALSVYSGIFMRFAWQVQPRNHLLLACHIFNSGVQIAKMATIYQYQQTPNAVIKNKFKPEMVGFGLAAIAAGLAAGPMLHKALVSSSLPTRLKSLANHPAGPFTVFFWAPIGKWGLSIESMIAYNKDLSEVSTTESAALILTGLIWTRYSFVITPVNYSLATVNFALALTSGYHLYRKYVFDPFSPKQAHSHTTTTSTTR